MASGPMALHRNAVPQGTTMGAADLTATDSLFQAWSAGDSAALEVLAPLLIEDLRLIAGKHLAHEVDCEWEPDDLVDEFFVRLLAKASVTWRNPEHFLATASLVMRHIIIDYARNRNRVKRGGEAEHVHLNLYDVLSHPQDGALVALTEALEGLHLKNADGAKVVELRFFVGLSYGEIAELLDISVMTVRRRWTTAKLELLRILQLPDPDDRLYGSIQ